MQIYRGRAGTMQVGKEAGRVQIDRGRAGTMQVGLQPGRRAGRSECR